jgi:parallel beta-helix repeat protein
LNKTASGIMLILFLISSLSFAFNIQSVRAEPGTIYIRANGLVEGTNKIITSDNVTYTFIDNVVNQSIVVERDNIAIDGWGYMLQGTGSGAGISLFGRTNVTVLNTLITAFLFGIDLEAYSSENSLVGNVISNCSYGIDLGGPSTSVNRISNNQIFWNQWGIQLGSMLGTSNVFRNNTMFDNRVNFGWAYPSMPIYLPYYIQDIDTSNTVNGKPIYYVVNVRDTVIPGNAGFAAVINSTNVAAENLNVTGNYQTMALQAASVIYAFSDNFTLQNVSTNMFNIVSCNDFAVKNCSGRFNFRYSNDSIITGSNASMDFWYSDNNRIENNTQANVDFLSSKNNYIVNNSYVSVLLQGSNGSIIKGNQGASVGISNYGSGATTWASKNNTISNNIVGDIEISGSYNNTICNNTIGSGHYSSIDLFNNTSGSGISLQGAYNNTIKYNNVTGGLVGIMLSAGYPLCENNTLVGNIVTNSTVGMLLLSERNVIKENVLIGNRYNFGGGELSADASNTINGKPVRIFANQSDFTIDPSTYPDIGYLALSNCTNVTIRNLTLTNNVEGLRLYDTKNVTVSNCTLQENVLGLDVRGSFNNIINSTISNNLHGVTLEGDGNNTINGNTITNNTYRNLAPGDPRFDLGYMPLIYSGYLKRLLYYYPSSAGCLILSYNNTLESNVITNNERGISILGGGNTFRNNVLKGNRLNVDLFVAGYSGYLYQLTQDMDSSNLIEGKPVYYWINQHDKQVPDNAGFVALVNCTNITVKNLNITHTRMGIILAGTNNTIITNVTATNCLYGILICNVQEPPGDGSLITSSYDTITNCTLTNNCAAIALMASNLTSVVNNVLSQNMIGIWILDGSFNLVEGNTITNNTLPESYVEPWPFPEWDGIAPIFLFAEWGGIVLDASLNTIAENVIAYNDVGLSVGNPAVGSPGGNLIYHNNFINNSEQVRVASLNFWNLGYPEGGNYFSDYTGTDNYSGINQTELGCDGIRDTPYPVSWVLGGSTYYSGWAYYPLMNPWTPTPTKILTINVTSILYKVVFNTNSTITHLRLNRTDVDHPRLIFNATGTVGTTGYCNVTLPKTLIKAEPKESWMILIDGEPIQGTITENNTYTFISFNYTYHSSVKIEIIGTQAVPEFQPFMLLPLLMIVMVFGALILKGKRNVKKQVHPFQKSSCPIQ